jgi:hypothetical protein
VTTATAPITAIAIAGAKKVIAPNVAHTTVANKVTTAPSATPKNTIPWILECQNDNGDISD